MIYGLDYLGGQKYRETLLKFHPQGWAAGFFANTFGNPWRTIEDLIQGGRTPRVRVHGIWEDNHMYHPSQHDSIIIHEHSNACALQARYPSVQVQYSPFCEHTIAYKPLKLLWDKLKVLGPVTLVNSAWTGAFLPGEINEIHGSNKVLPGRYNFSYDGTSAVDSDVSGFKNRHNTCDTFYFWVPQFNLRRTTDDKTPRDKRRAVPIPELLKSVIYLGNSRGDVKLDEHCIWKSHAEQLTTPPGARELKPCFLSSTKASFVKLILDDGSMLIKSGPPMSPVDGKYRYYFNEFGYSLAEKAIRRQSHPRCRVVINNKSVGTVNPAFRQNSYR